MNVIKTGVFNPPDGTTVRDSTMNAVCTWGQLMQAEAQVKTTNKSRDKESEKPDQPENTSKQSVKEEEERRLRNTGEKRRSRSLFKVTKVPSFVCT